MAKLQVTVEKRIPTSIIQIFASIGFWNERGESIFQDNKDGKLGSKKSQEFARQTDYDTFILTSIMYDIDTIISADDQKKHGLKCGKGGSHVWVSNKDNERILFLYMK